MIEFKNPKDRIILALDVEQKEEAISLIKELKDYVGVFKIGLPLYINSGPDIIKIIKEEGKEVFFDGKFHDIPNTVAKSCANLVKLGVSFFNLHITGSSKMISSAVKATREAAKEMGIEKPKILGVTLLSSFGQKTFTEELGYSANMDEYVMRMAKIATLSGMDGIITSASDMPKIKAEMGKDVILVCAATRPTWSVIDDQVRIVTPRDAIKSGADYLVIGRPVTLAENKQSAAQMIIDEIEEAINLKQEHEEVV